MTKLTRNCMFWWLYVLKHIIIMWLYVWWLYILWRFLFCDDTFSNFDILWHIHYCMCHKCFMTRHFVTLSFCDFTLFSCTIFSLEILAAWPSLIRIIWGVIAAKGVINQLTYCWPNFTQNVFLMYTTDTVNCHLLN
jgi:hypothetical protein